MPPIELAFPVGGVDRALAFQNQRPFTTPDALNVRPRGTIEGRDRGGSRPGLNKSYVLQLGASGGSPINLLELLRSTRSINQRRRFVEPFLDLTKWDAFQGSLPPTGISALSEDNSVALASGQVGIFKGGVIKTANVLGIDTAIGFTITASVRMTLGTRYELYGLMANTSPLNTQSVSATIDIYGPEDADFPNFRIRLYDGTTLKEQTFAINWPPAERDTFRRFSLFISPTKITVSLESLLGFMTVYHTSLGFEDGTFTNRGEKFGFVMRSLFVGRSEFPTLGGGQMDNLTVDYTTTAVATEPVPESMMAAAGGTLYREQPEGVMVAVGTNLTLSTSAPLQAVDRLGKLYIADQGERTRQTDAALDSTRLIFTSASVSDWTALGIDITTDRLEVLATGSLGFATPELYTIDSFASGSITVTSVAGSAADSDVTIRVLRVPKVYDSLTDATTIWTATANKGTVHPGGDLIANYQDRIVMSGDPENPGVVYFSRAGDPLDWDFGSATTAGSATAKVYSDSSTGGLAVPVTALISGWEDYLVIAAESEMWLLRGDPLLSGFVVNLSRTVGIIDKDAWCVTPNGSIFFLSRDGLYTLAAQPSAIPESVSRRRLPQELLNIDVSLTSVSLTYDIEEEGIHIHITSIVSGGPSTHFWFSLRTGGFFPARFRAIHEPFSLSHHPRTNKVLMGCRDGFLRSYDAGTTNDDTKAIPSYVVIGPIKLGRFDHEGFLQELDCVMSQDSGDVTWSVQVGETPEEAFGSAPFATGTWVAGRNYTDRVRARGTTAYVRVSNLSSSVRWALEELFARREELGKPRRL